MLALAIAAAVIVLTACGALLYYAAVSVDRLTEARETRLMQRAVQRRFARISDDIASVAVWSEAYDRTARTFDPEWAHINYGDYFYEYLHHQVSFVLAGDDSPIYAAVEGEVADPADLTGLVAASRRIVALVRVDAQAKISREPKALGFDRVAARQAAVRVGSKVYLVGASTVVPEPEYTAPLLKGPEPVIVSAVALDLAFLEDLRRDFGLGNARPARPGETPSVALAGPNGETVVELTWTPERPGVGVYRDALVPILAVGLVVTAAAAAVIRQVWLSARQVAQARDRAAAGERAKGDFIANISHEIRTPLNGVLGMAQVMERYELNPEQRGRLAIIRESGAALLALLNDVLDFSKMEAGKLELVNGPFRLEDLLEGVAATFRGVASSKGLQLEVRVTPEARGFWTGDALRIRQVLTNLTSNAVKFTDQGVVTLSAETTAQGVDFAVSDSGIGIDEADIPSLFDKFSQADPSATRRYGGTGLGLSISRGLADLMGGTLTATGRRGEGATFTLALPLERATETAPEPVAQAEAPGPLRILAADDNAANRVVLAALLEGTGASLMQVADGEAALEAFERESFDVVLMDVQMPRMNGLDAARAIRALEAERNAPRTPILALTANVMTHQIETYVAAGMDGHVAKPIDAAALFESLQAVLEARGTSAAA